MANTNITPSTCIFNPPPPGGGAATRLGLHVTDQELVIWQNRSVGGPYKSTGDVSTNSPGDWDRIVSYKNTFTGNPSGVRWTGQVSAQCWYVSAPSINQSQAIELLDAAFYALVKADSTVASTVVTELINQTGQAGTDFSDTSRWCLTYTGGTPIAYDGFIHDYADWLIRLLFAYDYLKAGGYVSAGNQTTLNQWFLDAAEYMELIPIHQVEQRFPNRSTDDYSSFGSGWNSSNLGSNIHPIYFGGPSWGDWHEGWNNRAGVLACFAGLVGVMQSNSSLIANAKRYFKEYVTYSVFFTNSTDCHGGEYQRWSDGFPCQGWGYNVDLNTSFMIFADALARTGDYEMIDYSTSSGLKGTTGGPKSLLGLMTTDEKYVVPDLTHYGTDQSGNQNSTYRIDTQDPLIPNNKIRDVAYAQGNLYFQDSFIQSCYMRTRAGAPAYPSSNIEATDCWGGARRLLSGSLFMFGQNEGVVNPFP